MSTTFLEVALKGDPRFQRFIAEISETNRKIKADNAIQRDLVNRNRKLVEEEFEREYSGRKKKWYEWFDMFSLDEVNKQIVSMDFIKEKEAQGLKLRYTEEKEIALTEANFITYLANEILHTKDSIPYPDRLN